MLERRSDATLSAPSFEVALFCPDCHWWSSPQPGAPSSCRDWQVCGASCSAGHCCGRSGALSLLGVTGRGQGVSSTAAQRKKTFLHRVPQTPGTGRLTSHTARHCALPQAWEVASPVLQLRAWASAPPCASGLVLRPSTCPRRLSSLNAGLGAGLLAWLYFRRQDERFGASPLAR